MKINGPEILKVSFANPFEAEGRWFKGNTHTHTNNSDGAWSPEEVRIEYGRKGYDFVFLTDHWKRTVPAPSKAKPLLIPAEEVDFSVESRLYHAVCLGIRKEWRKRTFSSVSEFVRLARRRCKFLVMAHPYWSGSRSETYLTAEDFDAMEVYNTVCDDGCAKGYSGTYWDDFLDAGKKVFGLAADDAHSSAAATRGWIMVKAESCTEESIISSLRKGHFYSSQGPQIKEIKITGNKVRVKCSPVSRINFIGNGYWGKVVRAVKMELTEAEWDIPMDVTHARIEIVDSEGRTAWSNPIWRREDKRLLERMKKQTLQKASAPIIRNIQRYGDIAKVDWTAAAVLKNWKTMVGGMTRRKLEARLIHDGIYLYIQLEDQINTRKLVVKGGPVWNDDEWELFFSKDLGRPCNQMGVNSIGKHMGIAHGKPSGAWDDGATVISESLSGRWRIRMVLPLAKLVKGGLRPGDTFYMNIVRSTAQGNALGWIPTFKHYYNEPSRLGAVKLLC